jgi:hypothetical protein
MREPKDRIEVFIGINYVDMNRARRGANLYAYFKLYSVYRGNLADSSGGLPKYRDVSLVGIFDGRVQLPFLITNISRAIR